MPAAVERPQAIARQRLHPLSPVLKSVRTLFLVVAAVSWRGLQNLGPDLYALVLLGLLVLVLLYSAVAWRFTGYEVVGRELRIHEGVLFRRTRAVPLERLQAIEVVQPVLARLAGLAELKLDVAGSGKAEAPLAFLPLAEADVLRTRLLALASRTSAATAETAPAATEPDAAQPEQADLYRVDNNEVMVSQFLTPPVMFTPLAILYIIGQLAFNSDFGVFAVASMVTAVAGTIGAPVMRILNFWNFRIGRAADERLRIRHGLLETRSQVVAPQRIQSLTVTWPLLWRGKGWLRVTLAVAGQSSVNADGRQSRAETDRLLPVATVDTARALVPLALPGLDINALPLSPVPHRARWLAPLRRRVLAAGLTEHAFATVDGLTTRQLTVVPYARIQSVRVTEGPWQRRLGLATVYVDVAGATPAAAVHRPLAEAFAWADDLTTRARAARAEV
ncbi:membrane protein [Catellatospora coxensis]|uniref:Membrane protein n=1 Tax=Catellatospora coxensis TaxID=310354 RepID=A0A8J3KZB5_9ACTN|nr:membrane protein [Catellatospora coxensis]